jgi:hypothetical protein
MCNRLGQEALALMALGFQPGEWQAENQGSA